MAAITVGGSGNWDSVTPNAPWPGGTLPTNADDVTINNAAHTLTIKGTGCVANSITVTLGTLNADTSASSDLTLGSSSATAIQNLIVANSASASVNLDVSSVPAVTCTVTLNAGSKTDSASSVAGRGILSSGQLVLVGADKTEVTTTTGALSATNTEADVVDATGWRQGDWVVLCTTDVYNATPKTDLMQLHGASYINGSTHLVFTSGLTYAHASGCYVGNMTRNLRIVGYSSSVQSFVTSITSTGTNKRVDSVEFSNVYGSSTFGTTGALTANSAGTVGWASISGNTFYQFTMNGLYLRGPQAAFTRDSNIFYSTLNSSQFAQWLSASGTNNVSGTDSNMHIFRSSGYGFGLNTPGHILSNPVFSGITGIIAYDSQITDSSVSGGEMFSNNSIIGNLAQVSMSFSGTGIGTKFSATNGKIASPSSLLQAVFDTCPMQTGSTFAATWASMPPASYVNIWNRNTSPATQEVWKPTGYTNPALARDETTPQNSTSTIKMRLDTAAVTLSHTFKILAKSGQAVTILFALKKDSASSVFTTLPKVTISGLGITPVTHSAMADNTNWQKFKLSATQSTGYDGELTVMFEAKAASGTPICFLSGLPVTPFITRCRHYGYDLDETSLTRTRNYSATVSAADQTNPTMGELEASEATANAIGGVTVSWGATSSITAFTASRTFQQLWDFVAAQACANVGSALPITAAGVVGSLSLFAQGNVTIDQTGTYDLSGAGSLSMGSYTLTYEFSTGSNYTYTGGAFSQATTVPSFNAGTLNIGAAGTYTFTQLAGMILSMTPTAPGTYALGASTFTGTIDLRNTSGTHAITVELPSGTSYTTANNTGATITVSVPVVTADISITGMPTAAAASTRLQIINHTALSASAWGANTVYATGAIVKRTTGFGSEQTAGLYFRATTGGTSHATTEPTWNTTVGGTTTDGTVTWTTYAVLFYDADPVTSSYVTTYIDGNQFLAGETVKVRFAEMDAGTSFKRYDITLVAATTGFSTVVDEVADEVYATNGLNGSSYEGTYSPNFALDYIVLDTNTDFSGVSAYAYFCYTLTTSNGMYEFWGGVTALDVGNYRIESDILNLYFDESTGFVKQTDSVRIYRKDGTRPALDPTTGGNGLEINWRVPVSVVSTGGSALTPTESAYLLALPSASSNASSVMSHADMVKLIKRGLNKFVLNPADGTVKVYDNDGTTILYSGIAYSDAAGTTLYDGTAAVHHTSRLT